MARQLDILALEPHFGGMRKRMMQTLLRCSRHRWRLLTLPPRRIDRRLLIASLWFSEQLSRGELGKVDLLFISEAMNLADFFRLVPALAEKPSVVYFHDNQLPDLQSRGREKPVDLVNLSTAMAASQAWFNSVFNLRTFLGRGTQMVNRHEALSTRNPMAELTSKSHVIAPPVDLTSLHQTMEEHKSVPHDPKHIVIDSRDFDVNVCNQTLARLARRKEPMTVSMIGKPRGLVSTIDLAHISETSETEQSRALIQAGMIVISRNNAPCDDLLIRALVAGCHPIVPSVGVYPEIIPEPLHKMCLHENTAESITDRILDAWYLDRPVVDPLSIEKILGQFNPVKACKEIDDRIEMLVYPPTPVRPPVN